MKGFPTARSSSKEEKPLSPLRARLHEVIFEADVFAIPSGIFSVELVAAARQQHRKVSTQVCRGCAKEGHDADAVHCKFCGSRL